MADPHPPSPETSTPEPDLADRILEGYWAHRLEHGTPPPSGYALAQKLGISERELFQHFSSLDSLEAATWERLVAKTIATLQADADYPAYPARQKILAFHFTYFEHALNQRSRLLQAFPRFKPGPVPCPLKAARKTFERWAEEVVQEGIESQEFADRKGLTDRYPQALFGVFWYVADFNLRDTSYRFEDTDALVEKVVSTFADGASNSFLDSAFDLARFLIGRR